MAARRRRRARPLLTPAVGGTDTWIVQEKKGRRTFSHGVWAEEATIEAIREQLEAERSTATYARRKASVARNREKAQAAYVEDFMAAVLAYLAFHPSHCRLAERLARAVTDHATPVGSGTVWTSPLKVGAD